MPLLLQFYYNQINQLMMTSMKLILVFSLFTLLFLCQSPRVLAQESHQLAPSGHQPLSETEKLAADGKLNSIDNRKLRVYVRKRIRPVGVGTRGRTSSAGRMQLSSLHVAPVLACALFIGFFL
ncbi:hypothetical protein SLE2022_151860 [Rubroshorea leprosula]